MNRIYNCIVYVTLFYFAVLRSQAVPAPFNAQPIDGEIINNVSNSLDFQAKSNVENDEAIVDASLQTASIEEKSGLSSAEQNLISENKLLSHEGSLNSVSSSGASDGSAGEIDGSQKENPNLETVQRAEISEAEQVIARSGSIDHQNFESQPIAERDSENLEEKSASTLEASNGLQRSSENSLLSLDSNEPGRVDIAPGSNDGEVVEEGAGMVNVAESDGKVTQVSEENAVKDQNQSMEEKFDQVSFNDESSTNGEETILHDDTSQIENEALVKQETAEGNEKIIENGHSVSEVSTTDVDPSGDLNTFGSAIAQKTNTGISETQGEKEILATEVKDQTEIIQNDPTQAVNMETVSENLSIENEETDNRPFNELPHDAKLASLPHDDAVFLNQIPGSDQEGLSHPSISQENNHAENPSLPVIGENVEPASVEKSEILSEEGLSQSQGDEENLPSVEKAVKSVLYSRTSSGQTTRSNNPNQDNFETQHFSSEESTNVLQNDEHELYNEQGQTNNGNAESSSANADGETYSTDDSLNQSVSETQSNPSEERITTDLNEKRVDPVDLDQTMEEISAHHTDARHGMEHEEENENMFVMNSGATFTMENENIEKLEKNEEDAVNRKAPLLASDDYEKDSSEGLGVFEKYASEREESERIHSVENAGVHSVEQEAEKDPQVVIQEQYQKRQALARDPDQKWDNQPQHMYTGYTYRPLHFNQEHKSDVLGQRKDANAPIHTGDRHTGHTALHDSSKTHSITDDSSVDDVLSQAEKPSRIEEELDPVPLADHSEVHSLDQTHVENTGGERELEAHTREKLETISKPRDIGSEIKEAFHGLLGLFFFVFAAKMGYKWFVSNRRRRMYVRKLRNTHKLDVNV